MNARNRKCIRCGLCLLLALMLSNSYALQFNGYVEGQERYFFHDAANSEQHQDYLSGALQITSVYDSGNIKLFYRYDDKDSAREHFDVREAILRWFHDEWELQAGVGVFFWGVAESQNLVNILNQDDLVEDVNGKVKLGQPHVKLSYGGEEDVFDLFVLPYFREREYFNEEGRLRFPLPVAEDALYESHEEKEHIDYALRWAHSGSDYEIAFSYFNGTNRDPVLTVSSAYPPIIIPYYEQIEQYGLEFQWIIDEWMFKSEVIDVNSAYQSYYAGTVGFEYTFYGVFNSLWDITSVIEYNYDERQNKNITVYDNDGFYGARISFNDVGSSQALIGVVLDHDNLEQFWRMNYSTRLGEAFWFSVESYLFNHARGNTSLLSYVERDDFIQLTLQWHFGG